MCVYILVAIFYYYNETSEAGNLLKKRLTWLSLLEVQGHGLAITLTLVKVLEPMDPK